MNTVSTSAALVALLALSGCGSVSNSRPDAESPAGSDNSNDSAIDGTGIDAPLAMEGTGIDAPLGSEIDADLGTDLDGGAAAAQVDAGGLTVDAGGLTVDAGTGATSSRAYKGHETDKDVNAFAAAYPSAMGTRLDDCQTCHKGGSFTITEAGKTSTVSKNACDFCHLIMYPMTGAAESQPRKYAETLNPYGVAYAVAGRTRQALLAIDLADSDGDGAANGAEIAVGKYPGDATSKPGQPNATLKTLTMAQLQTATAHSEFLLCNASRQQFDTYASYKGVKVRDLLALVGVNPDDPAVTGITVIAPDGYMKDFPSKNITAKYPAGKFYAGMDVATLGPTCGFVEYPANLSATLLDGGEIPDEQWLMLAYQRDGKAMQPSALDHKSGKIDGEGPLRIVVPQATAGKPDRGAGYSPTTCNDGLDYDGVADHNAGAMVRGVVAVRVNPLPAGVEDFDAKNGAWAFVANQTLIVYGYGIK